MVSKMIGCSLWVNLVLASWICTSMNSLSAITSV